MATNDNKRYYWLKLEEDFFKRHDIRIIESMPNGKDYILFYLKLLCESTSHEGYLRFSKTIPYNEEMLSTITNTNVDIVRSAVKVFTELKMMTKLDDGTLYFEQVKKMIGSETGQTLRKREAKERLNLIEGKVGVKNTQEIDIDIEKELDIDIDKEKEDKNRYKSIEARPLASELLQPLIDCGYIKEIDLFTESYIKLIEYLMNEYELRDIKIKIDYFIRSVCSPTVDRKNCEKPVVKYVYRDDDIKDKYFYFQTSMLKAFEMDICTMAICQEKK